jgi:hypothetical protein
MKNDHEFYYELINEFLDIDALMDFYKNTKDTDWRMHHGFRMCFVPLNSILWKTAFLQKLFDNYRIDINLFEVDPLTFYVWHVDIPRQTCINVLLQGYDGYTFYSSPKVINEKQIGQLRQITEVKYAPNKALLLNVRKEHCVMVKEQKRLLMSMSVYGTTYDEVLKFCKENNI